MALQFTHKSLDASVAQTGSRTEKRGKSGRRRTWYWLIGLALVGPALGYFGYRTMRSGPTDADALWEQAERDFRAGRYELVESALRRLLRVRERTPLDWFLSAQLEMVKNQNDQAVDDLDHVPDEHYMAAQARLLAGQIELRRNRVRLAEDRF